MAKAKSRSPQAQSSARPEGLNDQITRLKREVEVLQAFKDTTRMEWAGQAMQAIIGRWQPAETINETYAEDVACAAFDFADAMAREALSR